jgi:hypothetical protein
MAVGNTRVADAQQDGAVLSLYFKDVASDFEQWVLLTADRHHDNPFCNRAFEKRHLDEALERKALILDFGDLFCAMQGKYDPRSSMDDIRPEDVGQDYLDRIVSHAARDYAPYAPNWLLMGWGNHETNIRKRHGTDLTSNLAHRMNVDHHGNVHIGGYGGWVRFMFTIQKTRRQSINLKYHHGAGGGGPVTRGVIQTNRQAVYLPDADIAVNGHTHDLWYMPIARERLSAQGKQYQDLLHFVRVPGYKDEYADGTQGFHIERWGAPKPIGAAWLRLFYEDRGIKIEVTGALR